MPKRASLFHQRLKSFQGLLADSQVAFLSDRSDILYFTGFDFLVPEEREAFLIITKQAVACLQPTFSPPLDLDNIELMYGCYPSNITENVQQFLKKHASALAQPVILFDAEHLAVSEFRALEKLPAKLEAIDRSLIWQVRMVKDQPEQLALKKAGKIAAIAWEKTQTKITSGITELQLKQLLETELLKAGSEKPAFPTIVAFGPHTALPHHQPGKTKLKKNMAVLIDFGATAQRYRSDMTRSFWFGDKPDPEYLKIKQAVHTAYHAAVLKISNPKSSLTASEIDSAARDIIKKEGYGNNFIHTTGHGVGLDIHEQPSLNYHNPAIIKLGMTITIEPGIYLKNKFGYRHENLFIVTQKKPLNLTDPA